MNEKIKTWATKKAIKILATKEELKVEQVKIVKLQEFDSRYFCGKSHFGNYGAQNYLDFGPIFRYVKNIGNTDHISACKSKGLSDESIKLPATSDNTLAPSLNYVSTGIRMKFNDSIFKTR